MNKGDIVFDDADRQYFFDLLPQVIRRFGWIIIEPVLMTNYFHLVINTPEPTLSRGMKWLEQKFVQHINRRYGRVGRSSRGDSNIRSLRAAPICSNSALRRSEPCAGEDGRAAGNFLGVRSLVIGVP